jgi:HNH endonuclease
MLTAERLREVLHYDPATGMWTWLVRLNSRTQVGEPRFGARHSQGYWTLCIDGASHLTHRLAWLYMTGEWPPAGVEIDHENRVRSDCRWSNLRLATRSGNSQNSLHPNKYGLPGVRRLDGRWAARIRVNGVDQHLGLFATPQLASDAYLAAKALLHPHFSTTPKGTHAHRI